MTQIMKYVNKGKYKNLKELGYNKEAWGNSTNDVR